MYYIHGGKPLKPNTDNGKDKYMPLGLESDDRAKDGWEPTALEKYL